MGSVVSVNVGRPRLKQWRGRTTSTGIFKAPVAGRVAVRLENLDGDRQADLSVHGGPDKAVYAYPVEHYDAWRADLPGVDLPWGVFGENLSCSGGWLEDGVRIGDRFRIGDAEFEVSQPRLPCAKLNLRFERTDMVKRMLASGRFGFYFRVLREGTVGAGDAMDRIAESPSDLTVAEAARLMAIDRRDPRLLRRAVGVEALPRDWIREFRDRLATLDEEPATPSD
ncbi:MOSC domain-containing protein [Tautonia plasticadhaerens]|uniref:6-N-hydroxylaminopurine resistance protein n=1 Tax=Tautonia plasticadhaerens TaxID=2527974 RepID=A0A518H7R4_9BACT|nr:MOSC domain-containing protein [Tautonia plasticadhaerens]QDV36831.1 6-N-hydroxylaminopurine resistance protein [Tautonia plasticadhaerens]